MDADFEKKLMKLLKSNEIMCQKRYNMATGPKGSTNNPSCNFYMGAQAVFRDIIEAIEKGDLERLSKWGK